MQGNLANVALEHFADDGAIPNNALPVVIYRQAISKPMEALFDVNGWPSA